VRFSLSPHRGQRPQRLYFIDSDVLSVYINGRVRDPISQWASLFSLEGAGNDRFVPAPEAEALTQSIGQSITRFFIRSIQPATGRATKTLLLDG
jgi:hypothetical protein